MMTPDIADTLNNAARQAGIKLVIVDGQLDETALEHAKTSFVAHSPSLTIRAGQVTGRENFDARMRAAIAAYLDHPKGGDA